MLNYIKSSFKIEKDFSEYDYINKSVTVNRMVLRAATVFEIIVELVLMFRVLFLSNSGLGTLNNRIYFGFYLIYFILGIVFLFLDFHAELSVKVRYNIYLISGSVMLIWNTLFNIYDVYRANAVGNFTIIMAIVIFSFLFVMKPLYALLNLGCCYIPFALFLGKNFSSGEVINFSIMVLLCVLIYFVRYKHLCIELSQTNMINDIQQELSETQQKFRLSVEQYDMVRERGGYATFEYDVIADRIRFSDEWNAWFEGPKDIPDFKYFIQKAKALPADQKELLLKCIEGIKNGIPFQKTELMLPQKNGENAWFDLRVITYTNDRNEVVSGIGMLSDITDWKEKICQLERDIQMDLFTGLLNKTAIEHYGDKKLKKLKKGEILAMLILDMDGFKNINDSFGHPIGDYVLKRAADIIRQRAPARAKVGRIGGDEFIVLYLTDSLSEFEKYAEGLIGEVAAIRHDGHDVGVSCSIGVAAANSSEWTYTELYQAADAALYKAKNKGKGQISC